MNRGRDRIAKFLRARKQNDTVKIICLLALTGISFLISSLYHALRIYRYVESPAEYIITGSETVSNQRMDEIRQNKDVLQAGRQMEVPVSVLYGGEDGTMSCMALSGEYMEKLTGQKTTGSASRIYLNQAAFKELQKTVQIDEGTEFGIRYCAGEDAGTGTGAGRDGSEKGGEGDDGTGAAAAPSPGYRQAKLIVINTGREEAESFIYTAETQRRLPQEAVSLRVGFGKHDLDGSHVEFLGKLGYNIEKEEQILSEENELDRMLIHIRYGFLVFGICILGVLMGRRKII